MDSFLNTDKWLIIIWGDYLKCSIIIYQFILKT